VKSVADRLTERFEERAVRADTLAESPSSGREPLRFAAGLFRSQGRAASGVLEEHARGPLSGTLEHDLPRVEGPLRGVLRFLAQSGPLALRDGAASRAAEPADLFAARLRTAWTGGPEERQDFLSHAVLRPYAEALVHAGVELDRQRTPGSGRCPACGAPPSISFRRSVSGSDGGSPGSWGAGSAAAAAARSAAPICATTSRSPSKSPRRAPRRRSRFRARRPARPASGT
jgi:hypothetical protein